MKKLTIIVITLLAVLCTATVLSFANEEDTYDEKLLERSAYTTEQFTRLVIDTSGQAVATAQVAGYKGVTNKISITIYLQQYKGGKWITIASSSKTAESFKTELTLAKKVTRGYKYRACAYIYVFNNGTKECIIKYSDVAQC